jgi:flagellar biosynthesis/type III secretory pathway chaperone
MENCRDRLEQMLRAGVQCAAGLKAVLNTERSALEDQDTDALNSAALHKQSLLTELETHEAARHEICQANGFGSRADSMDELIQWCDAECLILGLWDQFVDLAKECSELNFSNGAIINVRRQQISGALAVVRGESRNHETYSQSGRGTSTSGQRVLAEI